MIKKFFNKLSIFTQNFFLKRELIILFFLIIIGGFLRLYRLEDLMTYLGDEGRDMLIVMDIVKGVNFPFIGPPTSIAELYLGPLYYYFITPFAWAYGMNPIGPTIFVVLLGIITIPLIYYVTKEIFNKNAGIIAAILYTISPLTVQFSRSSWNPNPLPFFSLLLILFLFKFWQKKQPKFLYLCIITFSIMLQLHYIVLLLIPFLIVLIALIGRRNLNIKSILISLVIFFLFLSPLILFDLKHNFLNFQGILTIFKGRAGEGFSLYDLFSRSRDRLRQLIALFFGFQERELITNTISIIILTLSLYKLIVKKGYKNIIIFGSFIWGIIMVGLYRHSFYPHYLGFLFPLPAILIAIAISWCIQKNIILKILSLLLFAMLIWKMLNVTWIYLSRPPVLNVKLVEKIVRQIQQQSNNEEFNFALLANNNYDYSYRYFFKLWNIPAVYKTEVAKQLFVVCEDEEVCHPQGNPKWEIALFDAAYNGNIKIAEEWQVDNSIKIYKFIPNNE